MTRALCLLALWMGLLLSAWGARADEAVIGVDPQFAPVAQMLTRSFTEKTGHELRLSVHEGTEIPAEVDVVLAPDADLPARLAAEGLGLPETLITYAMGPTGTALATQPRDAILMVAARDNRVARDFIAYLMTSDAWDLIVTHGFGAY